MSNFAVSLLLSAGIAGWLYFKFSRKGGEGNNRPAVIGAAATAVFLFIVIYLTLSTFVKK